MCSGTDVNNETDFEAIATKLMNIDGDSGKLSSFIMVKIGSNLEAVKTFL